MNWLNVVLVYVGLFCFAEAFFQSCGYNDQGKGVRVVYEDPNGTGAVPYTFDELKAVCSKCHPGSAPAIPLGDEAAFKASAKVKSEIEGGDMPPAAARGSFDKAKALAFFKPPVVKPKEGSGDGKGY